jgi:nucleoside-diphosphate-sugar epimerase
MKKIIVTGHNGFIGTHLVRLLKEDGFLVTGIDTNYFGEDCAFDKGMRPDFEIIKDTRTISPADLDGAYAVCHLAALSNDPMGALNEQLTFDINHIASVKIAKIAKDVGVEKYIFSSSCSMYGISDGNMALDETADFAPVTAYAKSKVYTERDVLPMASSDFSPTFMRNTTAYGISPKLRIDLVVNNLVGWAVTTNQIRIMSDGTPWRPLIHAEDIARAFVAVVKAPKENVNGKSFNVGINEENFQIKDIAKMVGEVVPNCEVVITGEHGSDSRSYKVNFDKIKNELPEFKPQWTLKKGIEDLYLNYRKEQMNEEKFNARFYIRLKQLQFLMDNDMINNNLFWNK